MSDLRGKLDLRRVSWRDLGATCQHAKCALVPFPLSSRDVKLPPNSLQPHGQFDIDHVLIAFWVMVQLLEEGFLALIEKAVGRVESLGGLLCGITIGVALSTIA